jgi:tRNA dimethylallyltransferase
MSAPHPFGRCLVLTGATGSGKSALALELAPALNAEIVSMDSMAVYRGFDIGTAKPTAEERTRVPHHLVDELDPWESASVAWWLERARSAVAEIESRGRRALIVGGTPLYLKALARGLFRGPPANAALREALEAEAAQFGSPRLHARLAHHDPVAAARIHPNDLKRIVRALEVWTVTGRPLSDWQREWADLAAGRPDIVCLDRPREELYERINTRVTAMLEAGWLDEASRLRELPRSPSREAAAAVGYRELWEYLDGARPWPETVARIQQRTRQFAKRQLTWFRRLPECHFATPELTRTRWTMKMA